MEFLLLEKRILFLLLFLIIYVYFMVIPQSIKSKSGNSYLFAISMVIKIEISCLKSLLFTNFHSSLINHITNLS